MDIVKSSLGLPLVFKFGVDKLYKRDIPISYWQYAGFTSKNDGLEYSKSRLININPRLLGRQRKADDFISRVKYAHDNELLNSVIVYDKKTGNSQKIISQNGLPLNLKKFLPISSKDRKNPKYQFKQFLSGSNLINGIINVTAEILFSSKPYIVQTSIPYYGKVEDYSEDLIINSVYDELERLYYDSIGITIVGDLIFRAINFNGNEQSILNFDGQMFYDSNPIEITNPMFNIVNIQQSKQDNCFYDLLNYYYGNGKEISPKKYMSLTNDLISLKSFCIKTGIELNVYDITGKLISYVKKNNPPRDLKSWQKTIQILAHNNHLYLLNKEPHPNNNYNNICNVNNIDECFSNILKDNKEPFNIIFSSIYDDKNYRPKIKSFQVGYTLFFNNPEYEICKNIIDKYNENLPNGRNKIEQVNPYTNLNNIIILISKNYEKENSFSIFPESKKFKKCGYTALNLQPNIIEQNIKTRDMSKCYTYTLKNLPFLIRADFSKYNYSKYSGEDIIDHYLYIIEPEYSSNILPDSNIYCGCTLKYAIKCNLKFTIIEFMETERIENCYSEMIHDLEKIFPYFDSNGKKDMNGFTLICNAINIFIGQMHCDNTFRNELVFNYERICNDNELESSGGKYLTFKVNDLNIKYNQTFKERSINNRKPIGILVNDLSRQHIYEYLVKNGVTDDRIVQIKTDSVSIIGDFKFHSDDPSVFGGFKDENFKPLKSDKIYYSGDILSFKLNDNFGMGILNLGYAGCGKTTSIIEYVRIHSDKKIKILTPTHISKTEYIDNNFDCDVISKYSFKHENRLLLSEYDQIIVDECGMISDSDWKMLFKLACMNKSIICYGDFTQLPPVNPEEILVREIYNIEIVPSLFGKFPEHFIKFMFSEIQDPLMLTNYRNDFTWQYYIDIMTGKLNPLDEVLKYSINMYNAEYIITWSHKTRLNYNKRILEYMGLQPDISVNGKYLENYIKENIRIIADDPSDSIKKLGVVNGMIYTILKIIKGKIFLQSNDKVILVSEGQIYHNFHPAYAINIYKLQSKTIKSYHWAIEDNWILKYDELRNIISYVIISRLSK